MEGEKIMIKRCLTALLLSLCLLISGCGKTGINETEKNEMGRKETESVRLPEDFRFALVWGVYGISSYDSQTGKLVKTTDTKTPEKYITTLTLDEDEMQMIYGLISSLNLNAYPKEYDPFNDPKSESKVYQTPSVTWEIQVFAKGKEYVISCPNIAGGTPKGYNDRATAFVDVFRQIRNFLMETEEWKALPEYEVFYR